MGNTSAINSDRSLGGDLLAGDGSTSYHRAVWGKRGVAVWGDRIYDGEYLVGQHRPDHDNDDLRAVLGMAI